MSALRYAYRSVTLDQDFLAEVGGEGYRRRHAIIALLVDPGLTAAFLMRLAVATRSRIGYVVARSVLMRNFSCDISRSAEIRGALYLPHPVGIVVGSGVKLGERVSVYQNVTLGAGRDHGYPIIESDAVLFPSSVIVGPINVGQRARVAAGAFVNFDVKPGETAGRPGSGREGA